MNYIMGVDLGQSQDYTAIGILERTAVDTGRTTELVQRRSTVRSGSTYGPGGSSGRYRSTAGQTKAEVAITENHYAARHSSVSLRVPPTRLRSSGSESCTTASRPKKANLR
jgi:hypothetical protein